MVGDEHVTLIPFVVQFALEGGAELKNNPLGTGSVTTTLLEIFGPKLVTVIV